MFLMTAKPLVKDAHLLASEDVYTELLDALPPTIHRQSESIEDIQGINQILASSMTLDPNDRCTVAGLDRMLAQLLAGNDLLVSVDSRSSDPPVEEMPLSEPTVGPNQPSLPEIETVLGAEPTVYPPPSEPEAASSLGGIRWFVYGTMGVIVLGFLGWFMAVSNVNSVDAEPEKSPDILLAEVEL